MFKVKNQRKDSTLPRNHLAIIAEKISQLTDQQINRNNILIIR